MEDPREYKQRRTAQQELEQRKAEREKERQRRANSMGILNRKEELSMERARRIRRICTCGALERGSVHNEDCPVVREARAKVR